MAQCCLCNKKIDAEGAALLSMTAAGYPRYLCDDCAKLLDTATLGKDFGEIQDAMGEIGEIMSKSDPDGVTYSLISKIMVDAAARGKLIKEGNYDFSKDEEPSEDEFDEIPEELRESEEDIEKDKKDAEKLKKFDKVYNIILIVAIAVAVAAVIWKLIDTFILSKQPTDPTAFIFRNPFA